MGLELTGSIVSPLGLASVALAGAGGLTDWRTRRIPNWLVVWGFGMGLALRLLGQEPFLSGLMGAGIALLVTLPLFVTGAIGAGDVKYLIAFGAILGNGRILPALLLIAVAGGLLALVTAIVRGRVKTLLKDSASLALYLVTRGRRGSRRSLGKADAGPPPIPLGIAIATGCILVWFL